jgi:hypothetical protein
MKKSWSDVSDESAPLLIERSRLRYAGADVGDRGSMRSRIRTLGLTLVSCVILFGWFHARMDGTETWVDGGRIRVGRFEWDQVCLFVVSCDHENAG